MNHLLIEQSILFLLFIPCFSGYCIANIIINNNIVNLFHIFLIILFQIIIVSILCYFYVLFNI
jgi:hypothetical protein